MSAGNGPSRPNGSRTYRLLLKLLPTDFRAQHGREMEAVFLEARDDARDRGVWARLTVWLAAVRDVVHASVRLRLSRRGRRTEPTPFGTRVEVFLLDLRQALRSLLRAPMYTAVALVTLALGIGANTAIFSAIDAVLFRPPAHVVEPDRLVTIYTSDYSGPRYGASSYPDFEDFVAGAPALAEASTVAMSPMNVDGEDGVTRILMAELVSGNYFDMLGATPARGRWFTDEEGSWDSGAAAAVISHGTWTRMFGADPSIVGQEVRVSGQLLTVVGVAPEGMGGGGFMPAVVPDLWLPPSSDALISGAGAFETRGSRGRLIRARMAPGTTLDVVDQQLQSVAAGLYETYPAEWTDIRDGPRRVTVTPDARMMPQMAGPVVVVSSLLTAIIGLILLIACANLATLALVRGARRARELAVRSALGAGRTRLARQVLMEAGLLAVLGGAAGLALALAATSFFETIRPSFADISLSIDLSAGPRVLLFSVGATAVALIAVGLLPALKASRSELSSIMKGPSPSGRWRFLGMRNALIVAQVSASLILLIGAGLLIRSVRAATSVDVGFTVQDVATMSLSLGSEGYEADEVRALFQRLASRIGARPEVESVGLMDLLPLASERRRSVQVEGYTPAAGEDMEFDYFAVDPGLLGTLEMPVVDGRGFDENDAADMPYVYLVNESFARRFWPGRSPVGERMTTARRQGTVVGVVADADYRSIGEDPRPAFFMPFDQTPSTRATLVARTTPSAASGLLAEMRDEVRAIDASLPIASLRTMTDVVAAEVLPQRVGAILLLVAGGVGLFLSVLGLYGVIAYLVSQRTREMGVRMALGASGPGIVRMVLSRGLLLALVGVAIGTVLAVAGTRFLESFLAGVSPVDPVVFGLTALLVVMVSGLAAYVPARRAAGVDPTMALREE
ncbi:MAG: ABC transporter permease [Gemmatimonadota bacterium]